MSDPTSSLNRLAKWRMLFAGWQLGTRTKSDPEAEAVRDHREATLLLRAEVTAISALLIANGVFTPEDLQGQVGREAEELMTLLERRFPGVVAHAGGLRIDKRVLPWMKGWKP